jgi:hypothetical protein
VEDGDAPRSGPLIHGKSPTSPREGGTLFDTVYRNVKLPLNYSGGLLIARGFIEELYVHLGFHPAWKYEQVRELVFTEGRLSEKFDRSASMAEIRRLMADSPEPTENMIEFINQAFDRRY